MINQIKSDIWQLCFHSFGSCVYVLKINNTIILIDTSSKTAQKELLNDLNKLKINPEKVNVIILTHNHYDHIENIHLFTNAKIYSPENLTESSKIKEVPELEIISAPGHSQESKCYLYKNILFSGDVLFHNGIGRTDLPGSSELQMKKTLKKLQKINYKILCPGHV